MKVQAHHRSFIAATSLVVAAVSVSAVQAESSCKGLVADQCSTKSSCIWVNGYTRKDGRSVKGYCRSRGGKSSGASPQSQAPNENRIDGQTAAGSLTSDLQG